MQSATYDFEFVNVEKPYETYTGANVRLRQVPISINNCLYCSFLCVEYMYTSCHKGYCVTTEWCYDFLCVSVTSENCCVVILSILATLKQFVFFIYWTSQNNENS